jgi:hypothetical protein
MKNIILKTWKNDSIITTSAEELFQNKRILICSIHLPHNKLTHAYLKELTACQIKYKDYGIEKIYIIDSYEDLWSIPVLNSFFPALGIVLDNNKQFVNYLKEEFKKQRSTEFLSKNWSYQLLLNNCKIEQFYEQPTENRLDDLKKYLIRKHYLHYIKEKSYKVPPPFTAETYNISSKIFNQNEELVFNSRNNAGINRKTIWYYNLWPNVELENYLEKNNDQKFRTRFLSGRG